MDIPAPQTIRIGTRGSRLALKQTDMVATGLRAQWPALQIDIVEIKTSGDWKPAEGETRLSEIAGGKGLFAKEIEEALLGGVIDCGVHSMKDMASFLPEGLILRHMLAREDARDAFLANDCKTLGELPHGATLGTSSLRRQAFVLGERPDLKIVPLRGNVQTRIEKLRAGQVDATLLAYAGLKRLGLQAEAASVLSPGEMLPAAGQGAIGIEMRGNDLTTQQLFDPLHHRETGLRVTAERAALQVLNGSCHTPIGAYAVLSGKTLHLHVAVASGDGGELYEVEESAPVETDGDAQAFGEAMGMALKAQVPPQLLA
jgi:hydroxymethylbilane synthase